MRNRLTERDLSRIVRRVINEGKSIQPLTSVQGDLFDTQGRPVKLKFDTAGNIISINTQTAIYKNSKS